MREHAEVEPNDRTGSVLGKMTAKPGGRECFSSEPVRPRLPTLLVSCGAAALGLFVALPSAGFAQTSPAVPSTNYLERLPNQNAAQRDMSRSIDRVCPKLVLRRPASGTPDRRSPDEIELQETCTRMRGTARLALETNNPNLAEQTNSAVQSIHGEEMQAAQEQIGDIQASNISGRLEAIRTGAVGRGFSIAGLPFGAGGPLASVHDYGGYSGGPLVASAAAEAAAMTLAQGEEGGPWFGPWGVFLTGSVAFGDKDATGTVDGFDFVLPGVTAGVDYQVSKNLVVGGAFGFSHFDADFDASPRSPAGQSLDTNSYSLSIFGSYFIKERFFVEGIASLGYSGYDSTRRVEIPSQMGAAPINTTANGDSDAIQYSLAANVGYQYTFYGVELQPVARLRYLAAEIDGFTETGAPGLNLEYGDQDVESFTTRVGLQASYAIDTRIGVVVPYVRGEYVHEFLNDDDGAQVHYAADPFFATDLAGSSAFVITTEDPDRNYGDLGVGVALTLPDGWVTFLDYAAVVGFADFAIHTVAAGFRKDF
jgi:outer membrane autotransporter protein